MCLTEMGERTKAPASSNIALVETGSDASLFDARNIHMKANTGFSASTPSGLLANRGLLRLLPTTKPVARDGVGVHTWVNEDPEPLFPPFNL